MEKIENRSRKQMTINFNNIPLPAPIKKYYTAIKKVREMTAENRSLTSGRERQQIFSHIQIRRDTSKMVGSTAGNEFMANLVKKYCGLARDHVVEIGKRPNGIRDLGFTCLFGLIGCSVGAHVGASLLPNGTISGALLGLPIGLHYGAHIIKKRSEKKVEVTKIKQENHPLTPKPKVPRNFSPPPYFFCPGEHGFWCSLADL